MSFSTKKIAALLLFLVLLPAMFFTAYELNNLSQNEEVLSTIYNRQLDAILFSVNQYSDDLANSWAGRINLLLNSETVDENEKTLNTILNENKAINFFFTVDSLNPTRINFYPKSGAELFSREMVGALLKQNDTKIKRLYTYYRSGYRKIEPGGDSTDENLSLLFFITDKPSGEKTICVIAVNPVIFINQNLSPRIQSISRDDFFISVFSKNKNYSFNRSENFNPKDIQQRKKLWLLPAYNLGIGLRGDSISHIVRQRTTTNMILISALTVLLLLGLYFVIRSIKKEVEFAQIKSDFVSNVSHELRTPLALISMFAETLEMGRIKSEEKTREYYSIISQEAGRLSRIVNKILSFSKMEAGKRTYNFSEVDLNQIAASVLTTYNFHLQSKGFKHSFAADDSLPKLYADGEALAEAFINLIDNAMKYSEEIKEINVKTGHDNGYIFLEVKDHGIGIAPENQKRIFEKFFRVSTGLVHNTKGTGLGLALVDHIMKAHNGKITLVSKPGSGSSFRLNLPKKREEQKS